MKKLSQSLKRYTALAILILGTCTAGAQTDDPDRISFGLHFDPVISWFGSDVRQIDNEGARPGFNLGITFNKYFGYNYAFSTGLNIINAGGRLSSTDTTLLKFSNFNSTVLPGDPVVYRIQYLSVPLGLKFQTNEIGYVSYIADVGIDPKVVIGGKADIPSNEIERENAAGELKLLNLGWHITAGIQYSLGGTTALVAGLRFENNFVDITKENNNQIKDKITHKLLSVRLGINF